MKTSHLVSILALSTAILATMTGCAADASEEEQQQQQQQSQQSENDDNSVKVNADTDQVGTTYIPRVTMKDIRDGFGSCVGTMCTINGKSWDCKGGGNCSPM